MSGNTQFMRTNATCKDCDAVINGDTNHIYKGHMYCLECKRRHEIDDMENNAQNNKCNCGGEGKYIMYLLIQEKTRTPTNAYRIRYQNTIKRKLCKTCHDNLIQIVGENGAIRIETRK